MTRRTTTKTAAVPEHCSDCGSYLREDLWGRLTCPTDYCPAHGELVATATRDLGALADWPPEPAP